MTKLALSQIGEIYYDILRYTWTHLFVKDTEDTLKTKLQKLFAALSVVGIVQMFGILHGIFYDTSDVFEEKAMHWAIFCNITCIVLKFLWIISNTALYKSLFIDFERLNCNLHRSDYARHELTKVNDFCRKIEKNCMYFMVFVYIVWYFAPALFSPLIILINGEEMTYEKITLYLPTTYTFSVNSPIRELRYLFENVNCVMVLALWQTHDISFFVIVCMLQAQYMVLNDSLKGRRDVTASDNREPLSLKKVIQDHVKLIRISNNLKEMLSPLLGLQLLDSVILIGVLGSSMATPTSKDSSLITMLGNSVQFASFLSLALVELLLFCWLSHVANESNQKLASAIYDNSEWYIDLVGKRDLVLPILISQRDMSFTALNMVGINLFSFLDVVRLSYSYFTMMKQFTKGD